MALGMDTLSSVHHTAVIWLAQLNTVDQFYFKEWQLSKPNAPQVSLV